MRVRTFCSSASKNAPESFLASAKEGVLSWETRGVWRVFKNPTIHSSVYFSSWFLSTTSLSRKTLSDCLCQVYFRHSSPPLCFINKTRCLLNPGVVICHLFSPLMVHKVCSSLDVIRVGFDLACMYALLGRSQVPWEPEAWSGSQSPRHADTFFFLLLRRLEEFTE